MNLISTVMAVGLFATMTVGGIQYIGVNTEARVKFSNAADAGFQVLESAFRARQAAGLAAPTAQTWESALFPSFGARPTPPKDLLWSYGADATGTWFCLSGTPKDPIAKEALERLKARYADEIYAVGDSCGAVAGKNGTLAATYWVMKATTPPAAATPGG